MIAWSTIETALASAIATCTGLADVTWQREPSQMHKPQYVVLERSPLTTIGDDAHEVNPVSLASRQHGWRSFDLQIRCTSNRGAPSDTAYVDAADILGLVQTRIRRGAILTALRAAGVALSSVGPVIRQTYSVDGREMRQAILTITWLCADVDADGTTADIIQHANGTITVASPDASTRATTFSTP